MADSYSVKAILSAQDSGFTSTLKKASSVVDKLGSKVGNFGFGILQGAGQAAFNAISNGVRDFVGEMNSSNAAWKTFEGNMKIIGKTEQEINSVKGTLQDYATQTIYSSSDMAGAYSQLAAVGIDAADTLVKGFGGLAGAAEDPAQAMKTLSQQGVQMAAKPKVAWQDFKLMLEQTQAGMAAVAKEMGMTASELVTAIQDGEVATNDFFDAVKKVGNSKDFTKLATQYKTVGQAMDGLKETLANKLNPAFDVLSQKGISAISGIIDKLGEIDGQKVADSVGKIVDKVEAFGNKCKPYIDAFTESFSGVRTEVLNAFTAIKDSLGELTGEFGSAESVASFKGVMQGIADAIKSVAQFCTEHSDSIAKFIAFLPKLAAGLALLKIGQTVAPAVHGVTSALGSLLSKASGKKAALDEVGDGLDNVGGKSAASGTQMLQAAGSFALMGVAVLVVAVGFAILAQAAIALSNAGGLAIGVMAGMVGAVVGLGIGMAALLKSLAPMAGQMMSVALAFLAMGAAVLLIAAGFAILAAASIALAGAGGAAIGVMVGMVAAIALLAVGAALLGTSLTAGAVGFIAFGAAVLMVGAGFALIGVAAMLAATALTIVAAVLPQIAASGLQGAVSIAALGVSLYVFAAGALVAAAGASALGAGLVVATVGVAAFGAAMLVASAGVLVMAAALKAVASQMKTIASSAKSAEQSLISMQNAVNVVESGLNALGAKAQQAMNKITTAFNNTASKAQSAGQRVGNGFTTGMQSGLAKAPGVARSAVSSVCATLSSGYGAAYSAGSYISQGFAAGMMSCLGQIRAAAAQMVAAANAAITAKARIASPSKVTTGYGEFYGEGFEIGIESMYGGVKKAAQKLVAIPNLAQPKLAHAYGGGLSSDYEYSQNAEYTIISPVTIDGREVAKATATYTQSELNKNERRESRKKGKV